MAGFAEGLAADPRLGELLGEYRIKELLGRGGMGVVYLAVHERLERNVALKLLAPALAQNAVVRERFIRESRRAAAIDHPNIIPVFEAGETGGHLFIAMRYVAGVNLQELMTAEGGRLDPERAVRVVAQIASALDAAHGVGLVHRDVKPANVMVDQNAGTDGEHCYLTDFGLTKDVSSSTGFTDTGQFVGTIHYVAPEQVEGGSLDARTDIYALGCVLYESLTGQVPFPRENDLAVMFAHVSEPPPRPSAVRRGLPDALDDVIAKAMAKSQDRRHRTCAELVADARAALAGDKQTSMPPVGAAPAPATPPVVAAPAPSQSSASQPMAPQPSASHAPPPSPPPSHAWTTPEGGYPPAAPPPSWPIAPHQPPPGDRGPNYVVAAAIVAIAVLLTTAAVVAAVVLSKGDGADGGNAKPSASESADARRLIEQTADLNREVIRLEERIARNKSSEQKLVARLDRERQQAEKLQQQTQSQLSKLHRVQSSLVASNRLIKRATQQLDKYLDTKAPGALDGATITIQQSAGEVNDAANAYNQDTGSSTETIPEGMQVDPGELPAVTLNVPDDANVTVVAGSGGRVTGLSGVGDVNGDGRDDLVVEANSEAFSGTFVVFGQPEATEVDVTDLGSDGFELTSAEGSTDFYGVTGAGDVDGDGNGDLIVPGPSGEEETDRRWAVVFGADDSSPVELSGPGDRVAILHLTGIDPGGGDGLAQSSIVGVGDVNGDGHDDIAAGSPNEQDRSANVWVVTGAAPGGDVDLDALGEDGFTVNGPHSGGFGGALSRVGDFNGDGTDDFAIGDPYASGRRGTTYVVFGSSDAKDIDIGDLGDGGVKLTGAAGGQSGGVLAGPGDVNGDGIDDLAVGAPYASPAGLSQAGVAYVVFGRKDAAPIDLTQLGDHGFRIDGQVAAPSQYSGEIYGTGATLEAVADANDDGKADLLVNSTRTGDSEPRSLFVVYGKPSAEGVDLSDPGGQAVELRPPPGKYLNAGRGLDFDGDKTQEIPFWLADTDSTGAEGYLIKVKR